MSDNGFQKENTTFAVCSSLNTFCLPRALLLRHMKLAHAPLVRVLQTAFTDIVQKRVWMKMCLRSLIRTILLEFVSAAVFQRNSIMRKDTVCHVLTIKTKISLHSKLN